MHPSAIGHTGFTGTSLWIDWEADIYAVLLTNRVHPRGDDDALRAVRPRFHDAVMGGLSDVQSDEP
jgi:CubicO group peptidase (beta-lactamase class C family)